MGCAWAVGRLRVSDLSRQIAELLNCEPPNDGDWLARLIETRLDALPMPGAGRTLERWMALAAVGQFDLSLTKLYEGHTDALAILEELDVAPQSSGSWCVWAAEAPAGRTIVRMKDDRAALNGSPREGGMAVLSGRKCWCSGAATADLALLTCWTEEGQGPYLVQVELNQAGVSVGHESWHAVGMANSASLNVTFDDAIGRVVGGKGAYLQRPGFWHGGAGIAACWYGGACGIAEALRKTFASSNSKTNFGDAAAQFKLASLGRTSLALRETRAVLREAALWIDANPKADASAVALRARLSAERCAKLVLDEVGKAMGATPFCLDEKFAKAAADLPVFIRQSHADRDFAALGERAIEEQWTLD